MEETNKSIFEGESVVIPLAEVSFIEKRNNGCIVVVMKSTRWSTELDDWDNCPGLQGKEAEEFIKAWCRYIDGLEALDVPF